MKMLFFVAAVALPTAALAAPGGGTAFCSIDYAKAVPCRVADRVDAAGNHATVFTIGKRQLRFAGRSQTGWWSGTLDGKPAMGLELNRGHTRFSTIDLTTSFDWWYKGQEHGRY